MKVETTVPCKVYRRGSKLILEAEDGRVETFELDWLTESPCMKELKRLPGFKEARKKGKAIVRERYRRYWWEVQFEKDGGVYKGYEFKNVRDYIIGRLLLGEELSDEKFGGVEKNQ